MTKSPDPCRINRGVKMNSFDIRSTIIALGSLLLLGYMFRKIWDE